MIDTICLNGLKFFEKAFELNEKHKDALVKYPARFRPNLNSISLVSLSCIRPQSGFTCNYNDLLHDIDMDAYLKKLDELPVPGRPVPEKCLQSWITRNAIYEGSFSFDPAIQFFTDEFAWRHTGTDVGEYDYSKVVMDILGFNQLTNALVVIELKSERAWTELKGQVNKAEALIRAKAPCITELLTTHSFDWQPPYSIEKIIVWPKADSKPYKQFPEDIREMSYTEIFKCCDYTIEEAEPISQ